MNSIQKTKCLKEKTTPLQTTFALYDFILKDFNILPYHENSNDCYVVLEMTNMTKNLHNNFFVKINFYDKNDNLYNSFSTKIIGTKFDCYDTIRIDCMDCGHLLDIAASAKIFLKKA